MKAARFFLLFIAFIASAYFVVFRGLSSSRAQSQASGTGSSCCGAEAPREVDFPYYNLSNGWESTLLLVSDSPKAMDFTLAVKSKLGQVLTTAETIQSGQKLSIDLASLITQLGGDPAGGFAEGSVAVYFVGTIMPILGQITARNPQLSLVHESVMVEHDPGRSDIPPVLNGLWWGLGGGRAANVMVSNTSANPQSAQVYLEFQGKQHPLNAPLTFVPYETKVLDITQLLTGLGADPAQAPEGGITIIQAGGNPALIANGRITDPAAGFSSTIDFPSPELERASALHASGVPIGTPGNDSPFAGAGTFVPHVVVRNLLASPQTVTITIEYPQVATGNGSMPSTPVPLNPVAAQDGKHSPATAQSPLGPLTVAAYSTQDISLAAVMNQFPAPLPFCSVRIQYSGPPGSLQAEVSSIESGGNLVVDGHVQNEGNGWAGSGAHPWHLDEDTEAILFLTNESDQPARIGFKVSANGVTYYLTSLQLNPHETRAIDMRKLRDAQQPDFKNNKIPAAATDGSVMWVRLDNLPVMGRLMVIHRQQGMASNYDCSPCPCPLNYVPALNYVSPGSSNLLVQGTVGLILYAGFWNCNYYPFYANVNGSSSWDTQYHAIATVNSAATVTGQSGGTTPVTGQHTDYTYTLNPLLFYCQASPLLGNGSGQANVITIQITSVNLTSAQVQVTLSATSSGTTGFLTLSWQGPSGNQPIVQNANVGGGSYSYSFNPGTLAVGQYTGVTGQWTVGTAVASTSHPTTFNVLGTYGQSQYNTPAESQCSGGTAPAFVTPGPTACAWTSVSMIAQFISQLWLNGSGISNSYGLLREYTTCLAPSGGNQNYFQQVASVTPACGGSLSNSTVAWPSSNNNNLACGDQVLIVGLGTGTGTVKTVTDKCPGCAAAQLDNFSTSNACTLTGLGNFQTIRLNR